jgi:hypothetical protein
VGLCEFSYVSAPEYDVIHSSNAFIYYGIIAPKSVGSDSVRCLRSIAWSRETEITFFPVQYVPSDKCEFRTVRVEFLGFYRKHVDFETAKGLQDLSSILGASHPPRLYKISVLALVT